MRNALVYVLKNHVKHGIALAGLDPCSSAPGFDGWKERVRRGSAARPAWARTWLLTLGWRRHGLVRAGEVPRGA